MTWTRSRRRRRGRRHAATRRGHSGAAREGRRFRGGARGAMWGTVAKSEELEPVLASEPPVQHERQDDPRSTEWLSASTGTGSGSATPPTYRQARIKPRSLGTRNRATGDP